MASTGNDRRVDHYGGDIGDKYYEFESHIKSLGFEYIDYGSFRSTFQRDQIVIKIPRNGDGIIDNRVEARAWRKYKSKPTDRGIYLAPCRLLSNGCLMMVTVDIEFLNWDNEGNIPEWAKANVEGEQCGVYRDRIVAYDYALDIGERREWEEEWGVFSEWFQTM